VVASDLSLTIILQKPVSVWTFLSHDRTDTRTSWWQWACLLRG